MNSLKQCFLLWISLIFDCLFSTLTDRFMNSINVLINLRIDLFCSRFNFTAELSQFFLEFAITANLKDKTFQKIFLLFLSQFTTSGIDLNLQNIANRFRNFSYEIIIRILIQFIFQFYNFQQILTGNTHSICFHRAQ